MRIVRTAIAIALALVAGGTIAQVTPSAAAQSSTPYVAAGTVTDASAPIDPTPAEGQSLAFVIDNLTEVTPAAASRLASPTGPMKVNAGPTTQYFKKNPSSGNYERSTYEATVVEGDAVRVSGRFVDHNGGTTFLASYVWNPPSTPSAGTGTAPGCTNVNEDMSAKPFLVVAKVATTTALVPCTGFGGSPLGFTLQDGTYSQMTPGIDQAIVDYGGYLRIYELPGWTKYIKGNAYSTRQEVVKAGNDVQVYGRYLHLNGGWIAVATYVWSPPPAAPTSVTTSSTFEAQSTNGTDYTGSGTSSRTVQMTLTWVPNGSNWSFTGTYKLISSEGSRLEGNIVSGSVNNGAVSAVLDVVTGTGAYQGMTGTGSMGGTASPSMPGTPPNALVGNMSFVLN